MSKSLDNVFYDTSQIFYCSGRIGYRWAVKTIEIAAKDLLISHVDTFTFQEVLDFFHHNKDHQRGEVIFKSVKRVMNKILPVTVEDFELAAELHTKYPTATPRVLLHGAVMSRNNLSLICTTFATGYENLPIVTRVNLMDKVVN